MVDDNCTNIEMRDFYKLQCGPMWFFMKTYKDYRCDSFLIIHDYNVNCQIKDVI